MFLKVEMFQKRVDDILKYQQHNVYSKKKWIPAFLEFKIYVLEVIIRLLENQKVLRIDIIYFAFRIYFAFSKYSVFTVYIVRITICKFTKPFQGNWIP